MFLLKTVTDPQRTFREKTCSTKKLHFPQDNGLHTTFNCGQRCRESAEPTTDNNNVSLIFFLYGRKLRCFHNLFSWIEIYEQFRHLIYRCEYNLGKN